ncbi:TetR family transcriptional regulator [Allostella vacuolata]|nr:TetR family transcriptional regulator [Stella vacuolata]
MDERPARGTYRHGDLQRALLDAGIALARAGGPEAVVLREATRRAGVVPNAAYRHFASRHDLLRAVRASALASLAAAMEAELAALPADADPATDARGRVRAVGIGYLRFARAEPGLFRAAFTISPDDWPAVAVPRPEDGRHPCQLLGAALDRMVEAGLLAADRRPGAEFVAWSAVHGLATLLIAGPLSRLDPAAADRVGDRLLEMVEKGLAG